MAQIGAIVVHIMDLSCGFHERAPASRAFRRALKVVAFGRKAESLATESHSSQRPVTLLARTRWGDGEAVLRFSPDLTRPDERRNYFVPSDWRYLDYRDLDLGVTAPVPIDVASANGTRKLILSIGKNGDAYLLDRDNLGGIGGEIARSQCDQKSRSRRRQFGPPTTVCLSRCKAMAQFVPQRSRGRELSR